MKERIAKWKSAPSSFSAVLETPADPQWNWWYWQEFGTATKREDKDGPDPGSSYLIRAQESQYLVFQGKEGLVFAKEVSHPGIRPARFVRSVEPMILTDAGAFVHEAFRDGASDNPDELRKAVVAAAEHAKELLVESLEKLVRGHRGINADFPKQSGKLGDRTAAEAFEAEVRVVLKTGEKLNG